MKRLAVVVCNSGLGHLKRVFYLVDLLCQRMPGKFEIRIFVDLTKLRKFAAFIDKFKVSNQRVEFLDIQADVLGYEEEFIANYKDELESADVIWSDNFVFPLKYRKEVFITGSFLWFEVMPDLPEMKRYEEIYFSQKPVLIGCRDFTTPRLQVVSSFVGVGLYNFFPSCGIGDSGRALLLSCGGTEGAREYFREQMPEIKEQVDRIAKETEVFVEPDFYETFKGPGVNKADFSARMFKEVAAAVTRPGMGTVCDTLATGGRIFAFYEGRNNAEVRHNALVLEKLGTGLKCDTVADALRAAEEYVKDETARRTHADVLKKLDFKGLDETVDKILEIVN